MDITAFDISIIYFLCDNLRNPVFDEIFKFISLTGEHGLVWIIPAVILICFKKTRKAGIVMLTALALGYTLGELIIKNIVCRPRPFVTFPDLVLTVPPPPQFSFPSGHTMTAFAAATALFINHKKSGIAALCYAVLMGFSRVYLCVHYPTDVLGGMIFGILTAMLSQILISFIIKRIESNKGKKSPEECENLTETDNETVKKI